MTVPRDKRQAMLQKLADHVDAALDSSNIGDELAHLQCAELWYNLLQQAKSQMITASLPIGEPAGAVRRLAPMRTRPFEAAPVISPADPPVAPG